MCIFMELYICTYVCVCACACMCVRVCMCVYNVHVNVCNATCTGTCTCSWYTIVIISSVSMETKSKLILTMASEAATPASDFTVIRLVPCSTCREGGGREGEGGWREGGREREATRCSQQLRYTYMYMYINTIHVHPIVPV